jgi:hypothetical protein
MNDTTTRAQQACLAWISDPGHAWLAVSLHPVYGLPEATRFGSQYSYFDPEGDEGEGILYLEEDFDAMEFVKAYGIDLSLVPETSFNDYDHFVRNSVSARFILV